MRAASTWPALSDGGVKPEMLKDSDGDGMPDHWEKEHTLNPLDKADGSTTTLSKTAYTNLEVYLNSLL